VRKPIRIEQIEIVKASRYLFVQIHTDAGITGLGEAGMWAYLDANEAVIRAWEPYLIGQDPLQIEHHWQYLYRNRHFRGAAVSGALGAIDTALWDIAGKLYELPVYQLLGGKVRSTVRVQTQVDAPTIDGLVRNARQDVGRGVTALRITPFAPDFFAMRTDAIMKEAVARVGALRETVGTGIDIGVEIHRRLSPGDAITLASKLEQFDPLYFEDPILPDSIESGADVARVIRLPIATGERLHTIFEFRELLTSGAARYARLDPCLAGGLTAGKKIAAIAESFHVGIMPHGSLSPVSTAVEVQLDACIPNFALQDYLGDDQPPKNDLLVENLSFDRGYLVVPDRPGLGVELKPNIAATYPYKPFTAPTPLHEDGSVADA
jgi:galactonate dehydratase